MATREEVLSTQETFLKEVADAIRDKDGTNELIAPIDFPSRIRAISTAVIEGAGLPVGGSLNQALMKNSGEDGDVRWGNVVVTFNGRSGFVYPQEGDYTADDVGAVPTYRTINSKSLESDVWLTADDVEAASKGDIQNLQFNLEAQIANAQLESRQGISELKSQMVTESSMQAAIRDYISSMNLIRYGLTALVDNVSSLNTGTIYVQYE